jgi:hypothetical protein
MQSSGHPIKQAAYDIQQQRSGPSQLIGKMPKNVADFVRHFFSDPHAVFNWVVSASDRLDREHGKADS